MLSIGLRDTHYMTFRHATAGLTRGSFTATLIKNGALVRNIAINIKELASKIYVASFANDGTNEAQWTLVIYETASPTADYQETWLTQSLATDKNVQFIKANI